MSAALLSESQRDALQEIVNISMGQAADSLARLIQTHVQLSIPQIRQTSTYNFFGLLCEQQQVYLARQSFWGELNGEMISLIGQTGSDEVAVLMHYDLPLKQPDVQELVLELTNILAGACLQGLTDQLGFKTHLAAPTLLAVELLPTPAQSWHQALLIEVSFVIADKGFQSRVMICLKQESTEPLIQHLELLLQ